MRISKKILCVVFSLIFVFGSALALAVSAEKSSPLKIKIETNKDKAATIGEIVVTVTVTNESDEDVTNVVVTSDKSTGLVYYKPIAKNVVIRNGSSVLLKKNSMTTCLKAGGSIKYSYHVVLGYEFAKSCVSEATLKQMYRQHLLLNTKNFIGIDAGSCSKVSDSRALTFGDAATELVVTAYYNMSASAYESII